MEEIPRLNLRRPVCSNIPLPESPKLPLEFLSRSWSASALEITKPLSCMASNKSACTDASSIPEDVTGEMVRGDCADQSVCQPVFFSLLLLLPSLYLSVSCHNQKCRRWLQGGSLTAVDPLT
uniref:VAN3-binding protein-like auxin canalisation domain-containing protein n=1 Tax=Salix viminalis TaxID=40686 RepID=A0A6N2KNK8_SALVM